MDWGPSLALKSIMYSYCLVFLILDLCELIFLSNKEGEFFFYRFSLDTT
jgi:hypothetical protein